MDQPALASLTFTAAEVEWIAAHPVVRVGLDPSWPPFSSVDARGNCVGIDVDLLKRLGRQLGITFECSTRGSWEEVYAAAQRGEFDVLAGTASTPEREKDFIFTEPYFRFPVVIVTRTDEPLLWSVLDLGGRKLVGVRGYAPTSEMQRRYPDLVVDLVDTVEQAMNRVADGEADAFVSNLPNVSFVAKTHGLTNLKIAGVLPESFDLRYAVRLDAPILRSLLDRAIRRLSEAERQAIVHPWIRVDYAKVIRWDIVWKTALGILLVFGTVIGAVVYHNRRLARELQARIRLQHQLEETGDALMRLNEEKTELLQMAAHDLRGPLTGIQLVMDASLRMNAVPQGEALRMVDEQVHRMTTLLGNLLDADALEHGRREFVCEPIEPAAMLRAAVASILPMADHKAIRLDTNAVPATMPPVQADATALRQILDNLLSNALKYSPRERTVTLAMEQRNGAVRLEVRDQGPGVAPHETERIFVKYARGTARPTGGEKSTGLGLSIVRQLATAMNGRVWCEHRPGEGGYFALVIPLAGLPTPSIAGPNAETKPG
ncbi:ATP-binding protein [Opitutus terrae]|nr:transporter substrate-binding domain-containing protein [Opitutus terrae]